MNRDAAPGSRQINVPGAYLLPVVWGDFGLWEPADRLWACLAAHWAIYKAFFFQGLARMADRALAAWYSLATSLTIVFVPTTYGVFIYFHF